MQGYRGVIPEREVIVLEGFTVREPAADEMVIRTRKTLISPGTERAFFLGLPNTTSTYPIYPGYNLIGEVIQTGEAVTGFQAGDRIVCQAPHASHIVIKAHRCLPVPANLTDEEAVFFQLLTIALQSIRKSGLEIGEAAAIIGAGPIGLLALQVARAAGAMPVIVIDKDEQRLPAAGQIGADIMLTASSDLGAWIQDKVGTKGVPVVIEATGSPAAIPTAFQIAAPLGRVVLLGSTRGDTESVNFYRDVHKKGLTIIGAHIDTTHMAASSSHHWWTLRDEQNVALKLLALKRVQVVPLLTHSFSGEQLTDAYALLAAWDQRVLAMLIDWN